MHIPSKSNCSAPWLVQFSLTVCHFIPMIELSQEQESRSSALCVLNILEVTLCIMWTTTLYFINSCSGFLQRVRPICLDGCRRKQEFKSYMFIESDWIVIRSPALYSMNPWTKFRWILLQIYCPRVGMINQCHLK